MTLATAQQYSIQIVNWLQRHCERIEVAGSVRRGLAHCNDIDVVCIPLEPITCPGHQRIWTVPSDIEQQINKALGL